MSLRLIGAGLGRTGTLSLKLAIEQLIGGTCHHMFEVVAHPDEVPIWDAAIRGEPPDWTRFLAGYSAIVDYPGAALWGELCQAFPEAPVLLSTRASAEVWWKSANSTILASVDRPPRDGDPDEPRREMAVAMFDRSLTPRWRQRNAGMAAYDTHNQRVRDTIEPERLFEYQPGDGWGPLCAALGVAVPAALFPETNSTAEFRRSTGLDG